MTGEWQLKLQETDPDMPPGGFLFCVEISDKREENGSWAGT